MINFTDELRDHNLKATPQRLAISNTINKQGHIDIDSLYEVMLQKFDSISLATIYKNINLMLKNSFIQEVKVPNSKAVYELTKEKHSHLVCLKCEKIEDITLNITNIIDVAEQKSGFKISKVDTIFSGVCKNCI